MRHGCAGQWWAAAPAAEWPADSDSRDEILTKWSEPYGDRRQELVFIGQNLDEQRLRADLDQCLLSDVELASGPAAWRRYSDPFPPWFAGEES